MTTATLNQDQRDAVLWLADDEIRFHPESASRLAALVGDLLLPDAEGRYRVVNVDRQPLIEFLEHELMLTLEGLDGERLLRSWHACTTLLDQLGHRVTGNIYRATVCTCPGCRAELLARAELMDRYIEGSES
jgi:hypothetical protein